jgi:hypothetical protein
VLAVASTHEVWLAGTDGEPVATEVGVLTAALPERAWVRLSAGEGSKGPRLYDWACVRLPVLPTDGFAKWVLVRRSIARPDELAYYRVFGSVATSLPQLVRVAGTRWVIEIPHPHYPHQAQRSVVSAASWGILPEQSTWSWLSA